MKLINQALQEKNFKIADLSSELQEKINQHKEMIVKYNMACDEYENETDTNPETEKKLDEQEDFIAKNESEIVAEIKAYQKADVPPADPIPAPPVVKTNKKDSSAGWLIFGGAVLLVTLGAVNVFKKK